MKYFQIIFSPTGGTEKAANAITQCWGQVETIDLSIANKDFSAITFNSDSLVLIAMPCFGGVAPQLALERLAMINGGSALCAIAVVYGNRAYDNTLVQMEDYAKGAGFKVIAAISAVAEHSIIRRFAAGRPCSDDCRQLSDFGSQILDKVNSKKLTEPTIPGSRPYKSSEAGMIPKADSTCNSCGVCVQSCPAGAISADNPRTSDKKKCISCMRCVSICPLHARNVSSVMTALAAAAIGKACSVEKANELFL